MRRDVREMHALYQAGLTLAEVGERHNLTRERVRQLFNKAGLPIRTPAQVGAAKRAQRDEHLQHLAARYRVLGDARAVASEAGTTVHAVETAVRKYVPRGERPIKRRPVTKHYSDTELLACLREAHAELGGVLSTASYESYRRGRRLQDGRAFPSHQAFRLRWGSWRQGLEAAGMTANPASPIAGQHLFTAGHCVDAVREVWKSVGDVPTARDYEEYARAMGGTIPSLATLRNRCGSWTTALERAIRLGSPVAATTSRTRG